MKKNLKNKNGFTLLELIITIFVITVGLIAVFNIAQYPLYYTSISISRLTAAYLAQEGIEIVRNIRDTNWLTGLNWDYGIVKTSDYQLDYQSLEFPDPACNLGAENYLKYDGSFYNCSSGTDTKFRREIKIEDVGDKLKVTVTVSWEQKGKPDSVEVQENLYDWGSNL